jgi:hypothetical protein
MGKVPVRKGTMNRQKGELPVEQTHGQSVLSEEPLQIIQPDHDAS